MPIFVGHNSNRIVNESMSRLENSEGTRVGRMTRFASFRTRITAEKIENPDPGSLLWKFLEENESSTAAWCWSILSICIIVVNSLGFIIESQPQFCCGNFSLTWDIINWVCLGFFTIEYGLRFYACPVSYGLDGAKKRDAMGYDNMKGYFKFKSKAYLQLLVKSRIRFFVNFQNLIDITAILPFYIQLMLTNPGPGLRFIRVIRTVRIFRLLKIGKYSKGLKLLINTMRKSLKALSSLALVMILLVVIMSTITWMLERGVWCDQSNNYCSGSGVDEEGILAAGWYYYPGAFQGATYSEGCSTAPYCRQARYGDMYPHTPAGKVLGCIVMLSGLLLLALPVTVISGNFATEYASEELIRLVNEEKKQQQLEEIQRWEKEFDESISQEPSSISRANRMLSLPVTPSSDVESLVSQSNGLHPHHESAEENSEPANGKDPHKSVSMPSDLFLSSQSRELFVIGKKFGDGQEMDKIPPPSPSLSPLPPPPLRVRLGSTEREADPLAPRARLGSTDLGNQINALMHKHVHTLMKELEDLIVERTKDIVEAVLEEEKKANL